MDMDIHLDKSGLLSYYINTHFKIKSYCTIWRPIQLLTKLPLGRIDRYSPY